MPERTEQGGHLELKTTLFRGMYSAKDRKPKVGNSPNKLGVRAKGHDHGENFDVYPDANGNVAPGAGMSVTSSDPKELPGHRKPKWLDGSSPSNELFVVEEIDVPPTLAVKQTGEKPTHFEVQPAEVMQLDVYRSELASTRGSWTFIQDAEALDNYLRQRRA